MTQFEEFWTSSFPDSPPIGFKLREQYYDRWIRFHSLPESKRYADNADERETLLLRSNALADRTLGEGTNCWLVACDPYGNEEVPSSRAFPVLSGKGHELSYAFRYDEPDEENGVIPWSIFATECIWEKGAFDQLIQSIADFSESQVLWCSKSDLAVFSPYDGGTDLILPSGAQRAKLKQEHKNWLSSEPSGL